MRMFIHKAWALFFAVWLFLLTGATAHFFGSPGAWQAIKLRALLADRRLELVQFQTEVVRLKKEAERLERSPIAQEREIRKVLGYVAPNELVFDFAQEGMN